MIRREYLLGARQTPLHRSRRVPTPRFIHCSVPMDSARSWVVAAACCWINIFTFAIYRSSAVVYFGILQEFHVTREQASWPVTVVAAVYAIGGNRMPLSFFHPIRVHMSQVYERAIFFNESSHCQIATLLTLRYRKILDLLYKPSYFVKVP